MNDIAVIENPLAGSVVTRPAASGAAATTDQQRAIAEVQAAMVIARANPRDERGAIDRILNACQRQRLAEQAVYTYARGGSDISGPSIRLAEAIAQSWGNIQFGMRELEQRNGESAVQAFAWDVETNVRREITFSVKHERHTRRGATRLTDPRDIYELMANQGARRVRACILAIIPGDVVEVAVEQCEATMKAKADTSPEAQQKIVVAFLEFGVVQQQIEQRIQRRLDAIQPAQIVALKKIYASLRDGMSTVADWFEPIEDDGKSEGQAAAQTKGNAAAKDALAAAAAKRQPAAAEPAQDPATGTTVTDEETARQLDAAGDGQGDDAGGDDAGGDQAEEEDESARRLRGFREDIDLVKTAKQLKAVDDRWVNARAAYDDEAAAEIDGLINAKRKSLAGEG